VLSLILLGGFLGAGKTTTMTAAARLLGSRGRRVAVVVNDQGDRLVDGEVARRAAAAAGDVAGGVGAASADVAGRAAAGVGEVRNGCYCCRFDEFVDVIGRLGDGGRVDTVVAEAVGSCADLKATVVRPLRRQRGDRIDVRPLTVVVEPARLEAVAELLAAPTRADDPRADLAYLFERQLQEADVIGLNKSDTRPARTIALMARLLDAAIPGAAVVPYSARSGLALDALVEAWERPSAVDRELELDYERYGRAEARLGWLDTDIALDPRPGSAGVRPCIWARSMLGHMSREAERRGYLVGHAKLAIETPAGLVTASVAAAGGDPQVDATAPATVPRASALLNARVACAPAELEALARRAALAADADAGAVSRVAATEAFSPAPPRPVHRLQPSRP
jgi:G3E family GTPase